MVSWDTCLLTAFDLGIGSLVYMVLVIVVAWKDRQFFRGGPIAWIAMYVVALVVARLVRAMFLSLE